jgi:hypothetical protein
MEDKIIDYLEDNTELEVIDFIEFDGEEYKFIAEYENEEVSLVVNIYNQVKLLIDGEYVPQAVYLPFNVWSN